MGEINIIEQAYKMQVYMLQEVTKFPRVYKYVVGDNIMRKVMEIYELLLDAYYTSKENKKPKLININIKLEQLRHSVRLTKDLKCINLNKYGVISKYIDDTGKSLGGWIKSM